MVELHTHGKVLEFLVFHHRAPDELTLVFGLCAVITDELSSIAESLEHVVHFECEQARFSFSRVSSFHARLSMDPLPGTPSAEF